MKPYSSGSMGVIAGPSFALLWRATSITLHPSLTFALSYSSMVALFNGPGRVPVSRENRVYKKSCTRVNSALERVAPLAAF